MTTSLSIQHTKDQAQALGFNLVGITPAVPSPHLHAYQDWLAAGRHGTMDYMARPDRQARRADMNVILPGVRSLVIVGLDYHTLRLPPTLLDDPARGRIAAYAWGRDYHDVMLPRLRELAGWLGAESGQATRSRVYVDTGAVLERSHAQQAGLGFTGKNTMLIHRRRGSDFFLGEVLTTAGFDAYDAPERASLCGTCTRCLAACPTDAFPKPYVLDARRCISYLTIEHAGWIDRMLRPKLGNWVFGCDLCQAVCPWQRFAVQSLESSFYPVAPRRAAPMLADLLALSERGFQDQFGGSAVARAGRARMVRNACVAAANGGQAQLAPLLEGLLGDASAMVRGHAGWALGRLKGAMAASELQAALERESDAEAAKELRAALDELPT